MAYKINDDREWFRESHTDGFKVEAAYILLMESLTILDIRFVIGTERYKIIQFF